MYKIKTLNKIAAVGLQELGDGFAAGDIRELLGTNRKYTLALLEYMDGHKLTQRVGERRFCGKGG